MLALFLAVLAAAWLIEAQDDNKSYQLHAAVNFIRTGERTPTVVDGTTVLTALGANQMFDLGQNIRGRYISDIDAGTRLGQQQIDGMAPNILNNDQLYIQTGDAAYLVAAAQSFMQGLYPPYSINLTRNGPFADATAILANGTAIDSPLNGYQYPDIYVASGLDAMSIYTAGTNNCPASQAESMMYLTTEDFLETKAESQDFYQALNASLFSGYLSQDQIDYINAVEIYDYLSYQYVHDNEIFAMLQNDSSYAGVYDELRYLADTQAWYYWGNTSASSSDDDYRAMAGRTVAAMILGSLQKVVMNGTGMFNDQPVEEPVEFHSLTLLFGEQEPFISLFSLMMLDFINDHFRAIPPFGSAMIFELFSMGQNNSAFPSNADDLWVRFYFQNGTNYQDSLQSYPMFGRGPSGTDMPWLDFQDMMSRIMTNQLSDWCSQCDSGSLFCWGVDDSTINITMTGRGGGSNYKISPAVGGVIGAVVTLAVAGIIFAIAMLIGGIRFHRVNKHDKNSSLGGFKGSAKLASDADLSLPKNGVAPAGIVSFGGENTRKTPHERVGSWELRQKEFGPDKTSGEVGDESRRESFEAIEAAMSRPVQPSERV
ncbi:histidine phosphatase superfamily [Lophiotrema nucula]|uniref:Histidine phosphatase superfamily n=1 Tax=Lophiotrema nucula TaxID=690887 RepID=A0A6A5ZNV5_9PLEO|nr:histidine phosphatase superfamily [Lophiotrema nucula]